MSSILFGSGNDTVVSLLSFMSSSEMVLFDSSKRVSLMDRLLRPNDGSDLPLVEGQ
jgi:hypothetical protein